MAVESCKKTSEIFEIPAISGVEKKSYFQAISFYYFVTQISNLNIDGLNKYGIKPPNCGIIDHVVARNTGYGIKWQIWVNKMRGRLVI